jgi:hypothetical protein
VSLATAMGDVLTCHDLILESFSFTTRAAQRRGLNFSSRMSVKQFHNSNKCLKIFQITLQTAKFDSSDAMFAVISTLSNTSWVAISLHVDSKT